MGKIFEVENIFSKVKWCLEKVYYDLIHRFNIVSTRIWTRRGLKLSKNENFRKKNTFFSTFSDTYFYQVTYHLRHGNSFFECNFGRCACPKKIDSRYFIAASLTPSAGCRIGPSCQDRKFSSCPKMPVSPI